MTEAQPRTVVITGGTAGIGLQSALALATTGHRVMIVGRDRTRGESAVQRITRETGSELIELVVGDVSSVAGIDAIAAEVLERTQRIDVLVNNAGYLGSEPATSDDGLELHFSQNVLGPWRLTHALLPALEAATKARVLNVTGGDKPAAIDVDNLQAEKGFRGLMTYSHSKSILESMSMVLAERLQPRGITVNVVFPGRASTDMTRSLTHKALPGPMKLMLPLFRLMFREDGGASAAKAARSTIWGATSPELQGVTGRYFDTHMNEQKLHPTAYDPRVQARIIGLIEAVESR